MPLRISGTQNPDGVVECFLVPPEPYPRHICDQGSSVRIPPDMRLRTFARSRALAWLM